MRDRDTDGQCTGDRFARAGVRTRTALLAAIAVLLVLAAVSAPAMAEAPGAPVNSVPPRLAGSAKDGSYMNVTPGKWLGLAPLTFAYQWLRCDPSGGGCSNIPSATRHAYKVAHEDVGHTVRVTVALTNTAGSASFTTGPSSTVAMLAPARGGLPAIPAPTVDGQLLTANPGAWKGTPPLLYAYQWLACPRAGCSPIAGATAQAYRPTTSEIGQKLRVVVTASNAAGHATLSSFSSPKVAPGPPVEVALPTISGTPLDGQTLSASNGTWAGTPPFAYHYQWLSCSALTGECSGIAGATSSSYKVAPLDVASSLEVAVTAANSLGSAAATSPGTGAVGGLLPSNTSLPSITGALLDGQLLSAVTGSWSGTNPISYAYKWQLCNSAGEGCKDIAGALESALKLGAGQVGSTLRVIVTATNSAGSTSATSAATNIIVALLPGNTSLPSITGSLIDGQLLSAVTGSWSGTGPISYTYQWEQCNAKGEACKELSGATGTTLGLLSSLVGSTVRVVVTATNGGGSTNATSAASGLIGALIPGNTSLPSITGSLIDGQLLSAVTGSWSGTGPISYTYQWQQCNAAGEACKDINEATGATLGLVSSLVGSTVRVIVTATNGGGSTKAISPAGGLIGALLPSNTALPSIGGLLKDTGLLSASTGSWTGTGPVTYTYQWSSATPLEKRARTSKKHSAPRCCSPAPTSAPRSA